MRWFALAILFIAGAAVAARWLPRETPASVDFAEYGAAARALAAGEDMYDPRTLLKYQLPAGWIGARPNHPEKTTPDAQMMWNPPWVAPLVLPLAAVDWHTGFGAWTAAQLAAVLAATTLLWRLYHGRGGLGMILLLAVLYPPVVFLLRVGQISGFVLLGLAGFAAALRINRPVLAGLALTLTAVKPHLLLSFAAVAAAVALTDRTTRRALLVGSGVLIVAANVPMIWRADVWSEYVAATRAPTDDYHVSTADWSPPVLSAKLAKFVAGPLWVQFLPSLLATFGLLIHWWRQRHGWDWARELPIITLICLLTTGYGAWGFDLVLLLLPVVQAAAWAVADGRERVPMYAAGAYLIFAATVMIGTVPVIVWTPIAAVFYLVLAVICRPVRRLGSDTDPNLISPSQSPSRDESVPTRRE